MAIIDEWFDTAKQIQSRFQIEPTALDYMALQERLNKRAKKQDFVKDDTQKIKVLFVYPILDAALLKLQERFEHLNEVKNLFGFLFDLHSSD